MPVRLAFEMEDEKKFTVIELIIDISFLIDIFLQFFSSYFDETNLVLVDTHRAIAIRYLKTWFIFDVLSIFPFEQFSKDSKFANAG